MAVGAANVKGIFSNAGMRASTQHTTPAIVVVATLRVHGVPPVMRDVASVRQVRLLAEMRASTSRVIR